MKSKMLKIAGVKTEAQFYKLFPTQEAFMKMHGKEFKKAQMGAVVTGGSSGFKPINYSDQFDQADKMITGSTGAERQLALEKQQAAAAAQKSSGGGFDIGGLMKLAGSAGGEGMEGMGDMASSFGGARYGTAIPRAQFGGNYNLGQAPNFQTGDLSSGLYKTAPYRLNSPTPMIPEFNAYNPQGDQVNTKMAKGIFEGANSIAPSPFPQENGWTKTSKALGKYAGPVGDIIGGIGALKQEKEAAKAAKQTKLVSDVSLQAAQSTDVDARRQMQDTFSKQRRAMMQPVTGESLFPVNGVGTNVLAKNGLMLQGGGEIQNTYDPNDIYTDSGYEPLNDSNVKQYYHGGRIHQMLDGGGMPWGEISHKATGIGQELMGGQNAGGQIGGTTGKALGTAFGGPVGGAIGEFVGGIAGNALDPYAKRIKKDTAATQRNMLGMASVNMAKGIQSQNQSYMEDGGWVSNDWQPQVIASFGGLDEQEVYDYAHEGMDTLRAGGHLRDYTPPSDRAMEIYKDGGEINSYGLGGELQTHWGGGAETISRNPYLPGTGETVMFRGKSHEEYSPNGETGIGVTYGGNPVEVERGEPMVELEEGGVVDPMTGEVQKSGVVFGNLKIPNQYINMLGDKNAKGKKFKNYVADLSKLEEKQNKLIEKSTNEVTALNPLTSFDKLKLTALHANIEGANMKLKDIADKKINAAHLQNAINDTAEEQGLVADDLARGKVKIDKEAMTTREARWGDAISKAQDGKTTPAVPPTKFKNAAEAAEKGYKKGADGKYHRTLKKFSTKESETKDAKALDYIPAGQKYDPTTGLHGKVTPQAFEETKKANSWFDWSGFDPKRKADVKRYQEAFNAKAKEVGSSANIKPDSDFGEQTVSARLNIAKKSEPATSEEELTAIVDEQPATPTVPTKPKFPWEAIGQGLKYLRPSDQEALDMTQLYPEMYAMATNQVEPVQANFYRPEIGVPYDISFQDQLDANQSDYRAAQRMMGYNPAAQANLNAQKYKANQTVLADQFRANQAMKDKVYGENRNILNDAKLKNLGIADQQYVRQSEALSNTKATTQAALNSIADKYAKNKLENRTLGVYENMYNYRFGKSGRAQNWNPFQFFDTEVGGDKGTNKRGLASGKEYTYDASGNIVGVRNSDKEDDVTPIKKNGGSIKKNQKNSSVVRAYKNL